MVSFHNNPTERVITARFDGKLNTATVQPLPDLIQAHLPAKGESPGLKVVFDLTEVDYVSSAFIRVCVSVAKRVGAKQFAVVNCQPPIKDIFKLAGLDLILNVS